ncbi:fascin-like [Pristis pectinata]|uniref:fascin-like n=1 Tax=Pristis pectinata TaxID=685728 RepID=UPI00223CF2A6|nr:fascin-like [Pristis pectinata]
MAFKVLPFGLINSAQKYLTGEVFNYKVNATGSSLKRNQIWTIEFTREDSPMVHIKSSFNRYIAADKDGKITCDQEAPTPNCVFLMMLHPDGRVSFQSEPSKRYLGGNQDNITCFAQAISDSEKWLPHLVIHPSINMFNPSRDNYLRLNEKTGRVCCDKCLPWGSDCVMTLYFDIKEKKYAIRTRNGSFIAFNGKTEPEISNRTLYHLQIKNGMICMKDMHGKFLSVKDYTVKAIKSLNPTADELFIIDPAPGQFSIMSLSNKKYVSCNAGPDVYSNVDDANNAETFQIMVHSTKKKVCFQHMSSYYLAVGAKGFIEVSTELEFNCWFQIVYNGEKAALKTSDGRYVTVNNDGQLLVGPNSIGKQEEFIFRLVNRSQLILQSEFGFIGVMPGKQILVCNRLMYEASNITITYDGFYQFKIVSLDKYWKVDEEGFINVTGEAPVNFTIELITSDQIILKGPNGKYIVAKSDGSFKAVGEDASSATLFRY